MYTQEQFHGNKTLTPSLSKIVFNSAPKRNVVCTYSKDMGLTLQEFHRVLPRALCTNEYNINMTGRVVRLESDDHKLRIECQPHADRKIGSLSIPRLVVHIELSGYEQADARQFINHFDLCYLRVGG